MINLPGVKFGTNSKNRWGKKEITQYYTPVAGKWPYGRSIKPIGVQGTPGKLIFS